MSVCATREFHILYLVLISSQQSFRAQFEAMITIIFADRLCYITAKSSYRGARVCDTFRSVSIDYDWMLIASEHPNSVGMSERFRGRLKVTLEVTVVISFSSKKKYIFSYFGFFADGSLCHLQVGWFAAYSSELRCVNVFLPSRKCIFRFLWDNHK